MPRIAPRSILPRRLPRRLGLSVLALGAGVAGALPERVRSQEFIRESAIVFTSTRHNPPANPFLSAEIYLGLTVPGEDTFPVLPPLPRRLTDNGAADTFAVLSPSGKQIVFDSNRRALAAGDLVRISDLYVMNVDEHDQASYVIPDSKHAHLTRGTSADWSPDGRWITFHASASDIYTAATLARCDPGAPTVDSDIFALNVDECIQHADECLAKQKLGQPGVLPEFVKKITNDNDPNWMDEDPNWSPDGTTIVFTRHYGENGTYDPCPTPPGTPPRNNWHAEIFVANADGSGGLTQLTHNDEEERAPMWSPDGNRILFMCRRSDPDDPHDGVPPATVGLFQLCVIERVAPDVWLETQLTNMPTLQHLSARWSPDGEYIVFQRPVPTLQLFRMTSQGTDEKQLTFPPGLNLFPSWGMVRVPSHAQ